jgi:hypothetical protein
MCGDAGCSHKATSASTRQVAARELAPLQKREGREWALASRVRLPSVVSDIDARVESVSKAVNLAGLTIGFIVREAMPAAAPYRKLMTVLRTRSSSSPITLNSIRHPVCA